MDAYLLLQLIINIIFQTFFAVRLDKKIQNDKDYKRIIKILLFTYIFVHTKQSTI